MKVIVNSLENFITDGDYIIGIYQDGDPIYFMHSDKVSDGPDLKTLILNGKEYKIKNFTKEELGNRFAVEFIIIRDMLYSVNW